MIDSITVFDPRPLESVAPVPGWTYGRRIIQPKLGSSDRQRQSFFCSDSATGYYGHGNPQEIRLHSASLPRLLHGFNGKLIKSQAELREAENLVFRIINKFGTASIPQHHFTRVDLVWQFYGDAAEFIRAHRAARHPRIHRDPALYEPRSLMLKGSEMVIRMYDKVRQEHSIDGNIVRVEIQLRGRRLMEELGHGNRVTSLDFNDCYQAYRRILLQFNTVQTTKISGIAQLLAIGEKENWQSNGLSPFDLYTAGKSLKQIRRIQKQMSVARCKIDHINWSQLLPMHHPPMPVEVSANRADRDLPRFL